MSAGTAVFDFTGRVAIVTGAGRGIGRSIAAGFAEAGATVVLTGRHEDELTAAAEQMGGTTLPVCVDIAQPDEVECIAEEALRAFGRIDVLVNNAGQGLVAPSEAVPLADWQRVLDVNLTGAFLLSRAAARTMLAAGRGAIVNVGSLTSYLGFPERAAYGASKAAIGQLTRTLASEWGPRGIRVNCVVPGFVATAPVRRLIEQGTLDADRIGARTPLRRLGEPDDLVGPVLFLASDAARFVTGAALPVDGGWLAYGYL